MPSLPIGTIVLMPLGENWDYGTWITADCEIADTVIHVYDSWTLPDGWTPPFPSPPFNIAIYTDWPEVVDREIMTVTSIDPLDPLAWTVSRIDPKFHHASDNSLTLVNSIPAGWQICDGTNGTPDIRGKLVPCANTDAGASFTVGETGGSTSFDITHSSHEIVTCTLLSPTFGHKHDVWWDYIHYATGNVNSRSTVDDDTFMQVDHGTWHDHDYTYHTEMEQPVYAGGPPYPWHSHPGVNGTFGESVPTTMSDVLPKCLTYLYIQRIS